MPGSPHGEALQHGGDDEDRSRRQEHVGHRQPAARLDELREPQHQRAAPAHKAEEDERTVCRDVPQRRIAVGVRDVAVLGRALKHDEPVGIIGHISDAVHPVREHDMGAGDDPDAALCRTDGDVGPQALQDRLSALRGGGGGCVVPVPLAFQPAVATSGLRSVQPGINLLLLLPREVAVELPGQVAVNALPQVVAVVRQQPLLPVLALRELHHLLQGVLPERLLPCFVRALLGDVRSLEKVISRQLELLPGLRATHPDVVWLMKGPPELLEATPGLRVLRSVPGLRRP
mmetsp:Transcript_18515/g.58777  ORF Transcript_18515/g.58777 Transcript_18515/m.58777 type:complete len:288 (-) Transcript_18515:127-990(-)